MTTVADTIKKLRDDIKIVKNNNRLNCNFPVMLAASKGQSVEVITQAIEAGVTHFGENRVQEAKEKWLALKPSYPDVQLHLIGPLQTNKVKEALALFDVIQTLDRPRLAEEIARCQASGVRCQKFFIQVNTGQEPQKAGVVPSEVDAFIAYCRTLGLPVAGLMCIPPIEQPPAPHFALLRQIAKRNHLHELSMGMSDDYEVAIRMGATCIRLGRALFGEREI